MSTDRPVVLIYGDQLTIYRNGSTQTMNVNTVPQLLEAFKDASAALIAAACAYEQHAKRHSSVDKSTADPFYSTRIQDMKNAADRAQTSWQQLPKEDEPSPATPKDSEIYKAIADNYALDAWNRERKQKPRELIDAEILLKAERHGLGYVGDDGRFYSDNNWKPSKQSAPNDITDSVLTFARDIFTSVRETSSGDTDGCDSSRS